MKDDRWALKKIEKEFPDLRLEKSNSTRKIFNAFNAISDYALSLLNSNRHKRLARVFKLVNKIRKQGNTITGIAIDNIFIYKMSTHIECAPCRKELIALMPKGMRNIMLHNFHSPAM